jgi:hypothetical protein
MQQYGSASYAAQFAGLIAPYALIRIAPIKRKGGIKVRRLIAATSDTYRAELLGLA